jgi:hypothetical protein
VIFRTFLFAMFETVALPANLQPQSTLVNLPAEIKHQIFKACLTFDDVISDPTVSGGTQRRAVQSLNVAILQTCRRLYHEIDRRPLFSQNTFRFTGVGTARLFLKTLDDRYRESVHDIEIDIRKVDTSLARDWLRYLAWGNGPWDSTSCSLHMDAPNLKTLRLNFESWPRVSMFRTELWILLRQMMATVRRLERIMVVGASKGQAMARRDPWSPAHFVGATDVDFDDLVPRMWKCVEAPDNDKIIRWGRKDGRLSLEVVSKNHLLRHVDRAWHSPSVRSQGEGCWPENGSCLWSDYEKKDLKVMDMSRKD